MLLRASSLRKAYDGKPALDGASLEVDRGEVVGVVGENGAGKSTLVSILGGALAPDSGSIEWEGRPIRLPSPRAAADAGIGLVHQHDTCIPRFTVAENLALAMGMPAFPHGAELAARARDLAARYGLDPGNPSAPCERLSVGARQRVEILKALARPTKCLLLDEPTAVLAPAEVGELLRVIRSLRDAGVAIVLIDHKLHEVLDVASRIVVLRRGRVVLEAATRDAPAAAIASAMVGHAVAPTSRPRPPREAETRLEARRASTAERPGRVALRDVSFSVRAGEILGVAGVDGNGQSELVEALVGLEPLASGELHVAAGGIAAIPPDRQGQGLLLEFSVEENLLLDRERLARAAPRGWLAPRRVRALASESIERFGIRAPGPDALARALSGGNQQKVVVARALMRGPAVLVAANPTRGLDVDATRAVHAELLAFAERGGAVVLVSTDLDEISAIAHRAVVMHRGRASDPFAVPFSSVDLARLGMAMAGGERA